MDKAYLQKFAKHLKELRAKNNLTQDDLASSEKISRSMISLLETARTDITLSKLKIIADALEIHPRELLNFD